MQGQLLLKIALVASGGALGALARVGLGGLITAWLGAAPLGTLAANLLGCLCMGAARGAAELYDWGTLAQRTFLFSGFLGAFTTFSTFEADSVTLWQAGQRALGALYLVGSVLGGLAAFGLGWFLTSRWMTAG